MKLPDSNDRHVLAEAIKANAQTIVIYNLSDFPSLAISKYGIEAQHPDEFLKHLFDLAPSKFTHTVEEYLIILEKQSLLQTVICLKEYTGLFNANCA